MTIACAGTNFLENRNPLLTFFSIDALFLTKLFLN